ncbi:MAG: LuxR C-terminal-related transcriptional regulator [Burkholderiales bacterium]
MYLSARKSQVLARVFEHLTHGYGSVAIREQVGRDLLELLDADYFASYIWNDETRHFVDRVAINMNDATLRTYEDYYQYRDPITFELQKRRDPTLVNQILPQSELVKTEFFNDFLARDGLYHGVNLYAYDGDRNIGDLRIWRSRKRDNFDADTIELLRLVQPAFTNAMRQVGGTNQTAISRNYRSRDGRLIALTNRESNVARLIADGLTDKAIAHALDLAFSTVRTHITRLFQKFGVHNRASLCRMLLCGYER